MDDKSGEDEVVLFFVSERLCLRFCGAAGDADDDGVDEDDAAAFLF